MRITPGTFHAADGVDDWRHVFAGVTAHFTTSSIAEGARFAAAIGELPAMAEPDRAIDVRDRSVTVILGSFQFNPADTDIDAARAISAVAREHGLVADPSQVQHVQVSIAHPADSEIIPFWRAALNYEDAGPEDLLDPHRRGPSFWFMELKAGEPKKRRVHVDISVAHDQAEARVAAILAAGGRIINDKHAPAGVTLQDAQGHYVDIATWMGRED